MTGHTVPWTNPAQALAGPGHQTQQKGSTT